MRVLVIAAHPDDEILGCGGTMARLARENHEVYVAILGEGITSRHTDPSTVNKSSLDRLHNQARHASKIVGAKDIFQFSLPDNRFDTVPLLDVTRIIENLIDQLSPSVIYTQHGGDLNIDHSITFRATLTAARPVTGQPVRAIYGYEVPSSSDWSFQQFSPSFRANTFVEIHDTLEVKLEAMQVYESETRPFPHPRSIETLRANALRWGSVSGLRAAEAFECVRDIR